MLVSVSTLLTTACKSAPIIETQTVIPAIHFPAFPDPTGYVELDEETETVRMPLDYYARIYEYKIRVDEAEAVYERIKELYDAATPPPRGPSRP